MTDFLGLDPFEWSGVRLPPLHKGKYQEPLSDDSRKRMQEYFAPHNRQFYELIGRDLGWE